MGHERPVLGGGDSQSVFHPLEGASARPLPLPVGAEATGLKSAAAENREAGENSAGVSFPLLAFEYADITLTEVAQDSPSWH